MSEPDAGCIFRIARADYAAGMVASESDMLVEIPCPSCGGSVLAPYRQLQLYRTAACACGLLFRVADEQLETQSTKVEPAP